MGFGLNSIQRNRTIQTAAIAATLLCGLAHAQGRHPVEIPDTTQRALPQHLRLYLKDGTYQLVLSYKVDGDIVHYRSAERNGETEDVPLKLVDLPTTERWKREHTDPQSPSADRPVLSPELAKEEAERRALTPEIAPNLLLPEEDSMLVLDTFRATPELVPVPQVGSDLNKETAHSVLKSAINPSSSPHRILEIPGFRSEIQLHVADPVFYVRVGDDIAAPIHGGGITVDTHGASGRATPSGGDPQNGYVVERVDPRQDSRIVDSFRIWQLGSGKPQRDVVEMKQEVLPGGHWMKLTLEQSLDFGEYALIEIVSDHEVNLNVWDFGVHSDAKENVEAIRPEVRKPAALEHRTP
jgi:hypothetical protein